MFVHFGLALCRSVHFRGQRPLVLKWHQQGQSAVPPVPHPHSNLGVHREVHKSRRCRRICRSAGGSLAVLSTPQEQRDVATLLNGTLAYMVKYNHVTDADFNLWMGLKRPNQGSGGWTTTTGTAVPQPSAWAADHPKRVDNQTCAGPCSCAVLGWCWSGNFSRWSYGCGWSDMALAALCRLPPVAKNEEAAVPKGA